MGEYRGIAPIAPKLPKEGYAMKTFAFRASLTLAAALLAVLALPTLAPAGEGYGHDHAAPAAAPAAEPAAASAGGALDPKAAFERLKGLAGEWQGATMSPDGPVTPDSFRVTAAGSVVMETMFAGTDHEMVNVFHMEGPDLVVTHYCAAGNQPRMRYAAEKSGPDRMVFDFAGGTNFDPAKDKHIHSTTLTFNGDKLESDWSSLDQGKEGEKLKLYLSRKP